MASFRGTPAAKHLALQLWQLGHELFVLEDVFFVFLDASFPAILLHFKGIGPDATCCSRNVVVVPANIDMVFVLKPFKKVVVALLSEVVDFDIDHSCFWFLFVFEQFLLY